MNYKIRDFLNKNKIFKNFLKKGFRYQNSRYFCIVKFIKLFRLYGKTKSN